MLVSPYLSWWYHQTQAYPRGPRGSHASGGLRGWLVFCQSPISDRPQRAFQFAQLADR